MSFNSGTFFIFFPLVAIILFIIPRRIRYIWLLLASYFFYMNWNVKYTVILIISTLITYLCGRLITYYDRKEIRKFILAVGIIADIGILAFFKYIDFWVPGIQILLPLGISFYTFRALGYLMDVYRQQIKAEKNIAKYALFVSFFPQILSGPIERSGNFFAQLEKLSCDKKLWNWERVANGLMLMVVGYFMKMVIADRMSILVNQVFHSYYLYGTFELVLAAVFFSLQIYCDFASYSFIAIGVTQIVGFQAMDNFNTPYFATSIQDFWRRWHISLSTWFRDYLYIPLGGSRCSKMRKFFNIMVTFLVSGMWHGSTLNYVVWGGIHGVYHVVGDVTKPWREGFYSLTHTKKDAHSFKGMKIMVTFALSTFAWIFFRVDEVGQGIHFIRRMISKFDPWVLFDGSLYQLGLNQFEMHILIVALMVLLIIDLIQYRYNLRIDQYLSNQNAGFRWSVTAALLLGIFIFGEYGSGYDAQQFIYNQF